MRIQYREFLDNLETVLQTESKLNPTSGASVKYIHQMVKQRTLLGPPIPAILLYVGNKPREIHKAIGYSPYPTIYLGVRTIIDSPVKQPPAAILSDLGLTELKTQQEVDYALYLITEVVEETLRADSTPTGQLKRRLNFTENVKSAIPVTTNFGVQDIGDGSTIIWSEVLIEIEMALK